MEPWQELLLALAGVWLWRAFRARRRRNRAFSNREAQRKLEMVLLPRETVRAVCAQKTGRWILTSRRLLLETDRGFTAIALKEIRKVQGRNEKGNRTTLPENMTHLVIQAGEEYTIRCTGEDFVPFARQLLKKTAKPQKAKKA